MGAVEKLLGFTKDLMLVLDRLEALSGAVGKLSDRVEEHERRLIRIEALIEFSMKSRATLIEREGSPTAKSPELPPPSV